MTTTSVTTHCDRCGRNIESSYIIVGDKKICGVCQWEKDTNPLPPADYSYMRGWICPVCGKGNSPYSTQCPCEPSRDIITGTTHPNLSNVTEEEARLIQQKLHNDFPINKQP